MKELVLSLLSRGYSQVVPTDGSGQHRRLEVRFEPEDYFNWRSQPPLLHLSSSDRLLSVAEPTPPKTYSTRRGPLILYSEDLALTCCQQVNINRKGRALRASREEAEIRLHTLQDLTAAVLAYGKKQSEAKRRCNSNLAQPLLPAGKCATHPSQSYRRPGEERGHVTQLTGEGREECTSFRGQVDAACPKGGQVRYQPRFFCSPWRPPLGPLPPITPGLAARWRRHRPRQALGETVTFMPSEPEEHSITGDTGTFKTTVELRRVQMNAIPESESGAEEEWAGQPEGHMVAERLAAYPKDINAQRKDSAAEPGGEGKGRSPSPAYAALRFGSSHLLGLSNDQRHTEEEYLQGPVKQCDTNTHTRRGNVCPDSSYGLFHLPPISQELPAGSSSKDRGVWMLKAGGAAEESHEDPVPQLPDIHFPDVSTEAPGPKPSERTVLRKVLVLLPSLTELDEPRGLPEDKSTRDDVLCSDVEQRADQIRRGQGVSLEHDCRFKASDQDPLICFEPEEDKEHQTAPGLLPPIAGLRGPGKQSSMALYRQDQTEPQSGITRGSLPLELRECQEGRALGTLIMGPAGEIIRLSLWDPLTDTEDHPAPDDGAREDVLRIMRTSEGVLEQPWTIFLEEKIPPTGAASASEAEAGPGHQRRAAPMKGLNEDLRHDCTQHAQTARAPPDYTEASEKAKTSDTDGNGVTEAPACAPEIGSGRVKRSPERQPYSKGANTKTQSRGRTQGLHPEGGGIPGSPQSKSTSASSLQRTALPKPTAAEELSHKVKAKPQMESFKPSVPGLGNIRAMKAGGGKEDIQKRKRKTKRDQATGQHDQHPGRFTEDKHSEEKTPQMNADTESLDSDVTADPIPDSLMRERKKTKVEDEKPKREPSKLQTKAKTVKKKVKGQAAFVVGKPRASQEVQQTKKEAGSPERAVKTASDTEVKEPEENLADDRDHCCGDSGRGPDDEQLSACRGDRLTTGSSRSLSSADWQFSAGTESSQRTSTAAEAGPCSPAPPSLSQPTPRRSAMVLRVHHPVSKPSESLSSSDAKGNDEAMNVRESKTAVVTQKAEQRRLEVERKRKEKEEERRRQEEREEREERMQLELEEEQRQRAEQARLRKLREVEERQREEERARERLRREKAVLERERRRQEEKRRLLERLQRERQEEEQRRAAQIKRQLQEEETRRQEEWNRLQEMEESERLEYLRRRWEEEELRRKAKEERQQAEDEVARREEEEARALAELLNRERSALEQQLRFHRGLFLEAGGLEQTQGVSRPWVFSYFTILKLLDFAEGYDSTQNTQSGC
ncbi:uncharacterized protein LOC113578550 [Electrophorus electricus]|uniref:uncharacterized protein LOC113578550 n=1 Tax=Electrophorus electricus TaxID=8005 RepID=UPI0015D0C20D|nr:uncharacterized protein LOC113578550 [Electrophorus electricus]